MPGFRYFGVLAGASFFIAGVVGLVLQTPLLDYGHAPCVGTTPALCGHGNWRAINTAKLLTMASLFTSFLVRAPRGDPHPKR